MSEIDFDELDRAVNGALVGETTNRPSSETPIVTPMERTRMDPTLTPAPASTPAPQPLSQSAPAARRSSGRFMDVIHPSSDMRAPVAERSVVNLNSQPKSITETPKASEQTSWNEPIESPFLPDAKVEKRPLGGITPNETPAKPFDFQGLLDEPEEELLEAPEPQELVEATTTPDPIDVVANPTSNSTPNPTPDSSADTTTEEVELENVESEQSNQQPVIETTPNSVSQTTETVAEEPTGPTSITQQYKEQPSSTQESGAIFDTESYHQPVTQPEKNKSGWLIVVWIVLLVVLGAATGWAVYTYVLPML